MHPPTSNRSPASGATTLSLRIDGLLEFRRIRPAARLFALREAVYDVLYIEFVRPFRGELREYAHVVAVRVRDDPQRDDRLLSAGHRHDGVKEGVALAVLADAAVDQYESAVGAPRDISHAAVARKIHISELSEKTVVLTVHFFLRLLSCRAAGSVMRLQSHASVFFAQDAPGSACTIIIP